MIQASFLWGTARDERELGDQAKAILEVLSDGGWHTVNELEEVSLSRRVAARIWDLKKAGHKIDSRRAHGRTWEYREVNNGGTHGA